MNTMIRLRQQPFILLCLLLLSHTLACGVALAESIPTKVVLGTATKGGGFQLHRRYRVVVDHGELR